MLGGDARQAWDPSVMPDMRVKHFWDEDKIAGRWFAEQWGGTSGIVWDIYYLYDPETTWEANLPLPLSSGVTIYAERQQLEEAMLRLLQP